VSSQFEELPESLSVLLHLLHFEFTHIFGIFLPAFKS